MGRKIGQNVRNELRIHDPVSGSAVVLYYRLPTTEERIAYSSAIFERDGEKVKITPGIPRHEYGSEILLGFEEGAFEKEADGSLIQFSSDPKSSAFDPEWKVLVIKYASDLLDVLAMHVFEGARVASSQREVIQKN
jgi:hypothetical protein